MRWHREANLRVLPWKEESDPYRIWLSEIILQQTRAAQGIPYYEAFVKAYPTLEELAAAPDQEVMKLWQGLGYYARCRNMLATARQIVAEHGGKFPESYEGLLKLKGIGPYTASAIASFAFGIPKAVVDGNVYRVLARYFALEIETDSTQGKKQFQALADEMLDIYDPGEYNQSIMDLGATVCTPGQADCKACPLSGSCQSKEDGTVYQFPLPKKKPVLKTRFFHYLVVHWNGHIWLRERKGKDIWQGLYEPLLVETDSILSKNDFARHEIFHSMKISPTPIDEGCATQKLSHQKIESQFFSIHTDEKPQMPEGGIWVKMRDLNDFPMPLTPHIFFEKKGYF